MNANKVHKDESDSMVCCEKRLGDKAKDDKNKRKNLRMKLSYAFVQLKSVTH